MRRNPHVVGRSVHESHNGGLQHPAVDLPVAIGVITTGKNPKSLGVGQNAAGGLIESILSAATIIGVLDLLDLRGFVGSVDGKPSVVIVVKYSRLNVTCQSPVDG